jgi:hypothetical protein
MDEELMWKVGSDLFASRDDCVYPVSWLKLITHEPQPRPGANPEQDFD